MKSILASVKSPADLKSLSATELKELADEIRQTIVATVAANGGTLLPTWEWWSSPSPFTWPSTAPETR